MPSISNFKGLVTDVDKADVPAGAAQKQTNLTTVKTGVLQARKGIQPITFSSERTISTSTYNTFQKMCFCKTRLGEIIGVNGVQRGFRWDGVSETVDVLGIDQPANKPTIISLVIRTGGVTDNEISAIAASSGTGTYKLTLTNASHGLSNDDVILVGNVVGTGAMPGALNGKKFIIENVAGANVELKNTTHDGTYTSGGTWSVEGEGATKSDKDVDGGYLLAYRYKDDSSTPVYSQLSEAENVSALTNDYFSWQNIAYSTNARVKTIELYRTTAATSNVFYLVGEIDNNSSGGNAVFTTDNEGDEVLMQRTGLPIHANPPGDLTLIGRRQVPPPTDMAYVVMFQDRYFYFGAVNYTSGTVTTANASKTVTGNGTSWTSDMVDRYIEIGGHSKSVKVTAFTDASTITIETASTISASSQSYVIYPEKSRRRQILYSYIDEPESVPETNSISLQENAGDDDAIVGAMPYGPFLYILGQRHKYALSYSRNPALDGSVRFLDDRGAFNQYCWDYFENEAFLMDDSGCYKFDGKESETISAPIQDLFRRDGTGNRIDYTKSGNFFVKVDRAQEKVYFFVVYTGDSGDYPTRSLVYNIRRQTWDPMHYPLQVSSASSIEKDGESRLVLGGENEKVLMLDEGSTDIVTSETTGTVTGATGTTLTDSSASFASAMVGTSVYITDGTGKGQRRTITAQSSTQLTVAAWDTNPDTTSTYVIGAIEWNWKSTAFPMSPTGDREDRSVGVKFNPTSNTHSMDLRFYYNNDTSPMIHETSFGFGDAVEIKDTNKEDVVIHMEKDRSGAVGSSTGIERYPFDGLYTHHSTNDHQVAIELRGFSGANQPEIQQVDVQGVSQTSGGAGT